MSNRTMPFLELIHDLIRDRELRTRFNTSPLHIAREYGLSGAEIADLFSMNPERMGKRVGLSLKQLNFEFMSGEFPLVSPDFAPDPSLAQAEYPSPEPQIFRIRPRRLKLSGLETDDDGNRKPIEFHIFGQSFSPDASFELEEKSGTGSLAISGHRVFGTFRCSQAYGLVTPPSTPGSYKVKVINTPLETDRTEIPAPADLLLEFKS